MADALNDPDAFAVLQHDHLADRAVYVEGINQLVAEVLALAKKVEHVH